MPKRETIQSLWDVYLGKYFDAYGHYRGAEDAKFENEVFAVSPYYWGDDEELMDEPNFIFKPTGFKAQWYKYPWRDAYCNKKISIGEFEEMLRHCRESLCIQ